MGWLKDIRESMAAARAGTPDLSRMTPKQRERYDANMAHIAEARAASQASYEEASGIHREAKAARILQGPAADYLYGRSEMGWAKGELRHAVKQTFSLEGPREVEDPAERARIAIAERAQRDVARAPYNAPDLPELRISRLATRGRSQIEELIAHLRDSGLAAHPERVYGAYRVPDRISPHLTPNSEEGRVVEWDVVHEPGELPATSAEVAGASFEARGQWIARRVGDPAVLDEELALLYCAWAGVGPEDCLGIARVPNFRAARWTAQEHSDLVPVVEAVAALHRAVPGADGMRERMVAGAPLSVTPEQLRLAHVEVLEWHEIARVVHPRVQRSWRVPSPMPYLPSTPQELLRAYLEIVGVRAADCYSAQVTIDAPVELMGENMLGDTNIGPKQPCADGKDRRRLHGGRLVVIAYRDGPGYAEGRARWAAYQRDVLLARLDDATTARTPLWVDDDSDVNNPTLRAALGALRRIDRVTDAIERFGADDPPPPVRYCWPPVGA